MTRSDNPSWWRTLGARQWPWLIVGAVLLVEAGVAIFFRVNDFQWHLWLGESFIAGDPYRNRGDWYAVGRCMINAAPALLPVPVARALVYSLAVLGLWLTLRGWEFLAGIRDPASASISATATLWALVLLHPYIIRDLDDCGLQLLLLAMLTAAGVALQRGRDAVAGGWLGLAVAYKSAPLLFLPFLVWKQRFKAAGAMVVAIVVFNLLLPACWLGWEKAWSANRQWLTRARSVSQQADIAENGFEAPRVQNQSLPMAVARWVQDYPMGHPLRLDHPGYWATGFLEPSTAKRFTQAIVLALGVSLAWRFRKRWGVGPDDGDLPVEWAVACAFCSLLAPLCWLHHFVLLLPSAYLGVRAELAAPRMPWSRRAAWGFIALVVLGLQRDVVQYDLSLLILSYKLDTLAMLALLALTLTAKRGATSAVAATPTLALARAA